MHTERPGQTTSSSSRASVDWPPPDPVTAQLTRRPPTVGRRTHLIGAGAAGLVVVLGLGAALALGSSGPGSGSPTLAGATGRTSPAPSAASSTAPSATETPHPTTSDFDAAVPDPTPVPSTPTVNILIPVTALKQGDCVRDALSKQTVIKDVFLVPCTKPHAVEVYATYDLTGGSSFPGRTTVRRQAEAGCRSRFPAFDGRSVSSSNLELSDLAPTAESWPVAGGKSVLCLVAEPNEKTRTGSLRNSRR